MVRKILDCTEAEYLNLDIHEFHAINDLTGEVHSFRTARDRNEFMELENESEVEE